MRSCITEALNDVNGVQKDQKTMCLVPKDRQCNQLFEMNKIRPACSCITDSPEMENDLE